ncbi:MAG: hypothetical protein ABIN18_13500 [Pseudomonadota bacterium]
MSVKIRILGSANRTMQRAGFLKLICAQTARVETSNIDTLGKQFVQGLLKRVRLTPPYSKPVQEYVRVRLTDKVYQDLRKAILNSVPLGRAVSMEIQDLYLSDPQMISITGKIVEADWRRYPYLATSLGLVKLGTYSILTRALVFLAVTSKAELNAFDTYEEECNPLFLSPEQAGILLYCFIDNDAEIIHRLFSALPHKKEEIFDERKAGDMLPQIIRQSLNSFRNSVLPVEDRDRLSTLEKVAGRIEEWRGKPYTGSGSREEFVRVRLEPYCDLGLLTKPDRHRFAYRITPALKTLLKEWHEPESTDDFLETRFFRTLAKLHRLKVRKANDAASKAAVFDAGQTLKSTLGYSPITDVGLLAGIRLLFQNKLILELSRTRTLLREWQKESPEVVRFTVDRMGALAYVKFLVPPSPTGKK